MYLLSSCLCFLFLHFFFVCGFPVLFSYLWFLLQQNNLTKYTSVLLVVIIILLFYKFASLFDIIILFYCNSLLNNYYSHTHENDMFFYIYELMPNLKSNLNQNTNPFTRHILVILLPIMIFHFPFRFRIHTNYFTVYILMLHYYFNPFLFVKIIIFWIFRVWFVIESETIIE